jgi:hypothetical protein
MPHTGKALHMWGKHCTAELDHHNYGTPLKWHWYRFQSYSSSLPFFSPSFHLFPPIASAFQTSPFRCFSPLNSPVTLHSCHSFFRAIFRISKKICNMYLSQSGLFHLIWCFLASFIFLQTKTFIKYHSDFCTVCTNFDSKPQYIRIPFYLHLHHL